MCQDPLNTYRGASTRAERLTAQLEEAHDERAHALLQAHTQGASVRTLAAQTGLSPGRVHQLLQRARGRIGASPS